MTLDWEKQLRVGVNGLMAEICEKRAALYLEENSALSKDEFYEECIVELEALLGLAGRYAAAARSMGKDDVADMRAFRSACRIIRGGVRFFSLPCHERAAHGRLRR